MRNKILLVIILLVILAYFGREFGEFIGQVLSGLMDAGEGIQKGVK